MSIIFADDFKGYGTNTAFMTNGLYAEISSGCSLVNDPDGQDAGEVLQIGSNGSNNATDFRRVLPAGAASTVGVAFRLWLIQLPANNNGQTHHIEFRDVANNVIAFMYVLSTGAIRFVCGNVNYDTPVPIAIANAWQHYEVKYSHSGANLGSFEVRIEGVTILKQTNVAGIDSDIAQVAQSRGNINGDVPNYVKDLVCWNGNGQENNDFLGTVSVIEMLPDSDVSLGWTPSTGNTGYNLVNQSPPLDNTDFITAAYPPPPPSEFTVSDLPPSVTRVYALIGQVRARKADGGDGNVQTSLISNGTSVLGTDRPMSTAFTYYEDVFENDPHTGAPWTPAAANAAQLEINRTV